MPGADDIGSLLMKFLNGFGLGFKLAKTAAALVQPTTCSFSKSVANISSLGKTPTYTPQLNCHQLQTL